MVVFYLSNLKLFDLSSRETRVVFFLGMGVDVKIRGARHAMRPPDRLLYIAVIMFFDICFYKIFSLK